MAGIEAAEWGSHQTRENRDRTLERVSEFEDLRREVFYLGVWGGVGSAWGRVAQALSRNSQSADGVAAFRAEASSPRAVRLQPHVRRDHLNASSL
jgi:hypothetical protein